MFKTQNTFERIKLSRQLEETFISLYDPEHKLSPLSCLRTTRGLMNTFVTLFQDITDTLESHLELIHPKKTTTYDSYIDYFNFLKAFYETLRKTNIKLAFTPSKVPPKEYDNTFVWYYSDEDIEKEDPMIVENADDYTYTKNDINDFPPSTKKQNTKKHYEDMVDAISYGLGSFDLKYAKPFHPDEDLLIAITNLIFKWCETVGIDSNSAKYHILAELYSMMRRFVMLKTPKEKDNDIGD